MNLVARSDGMGHNITTWKYHLTHERSFQVLGTHNFIKLLGYPGVNALGTDAAYNKNTDRAIIITTGSKKYVVKY